MWNIRYMNMKKIGILIVMALFFVATCHAESEKEGSIKFETTVHDFGNIKETAGPQIYKFKFTNVGQAPLKIKNAKAECGCTKPEFPVKEIAPGESGYITVAYNPRGNRGGFTKTVTVRSTGSPGKVVLKIRGTVIPDL